MALSFLSNFTMCPSVFKRRVPVAQAINQPCNFCLGLGGTANNSVMIPEALVSHSSAEPPAWQRVLESKSGKAFLFIIIIFLTNAEATTCELKAVF